MMKHYIIDDELISSSTYSLLTQANSETTNHQKDYDFNNDCISESDSYISQSLVEFDDDYSPTPNVSYSNGSHHNFSEEIGFLDTDLPCIQHLSKTESESSSSHLSSTSSINSSKRDYISPKNSLGKNPISSSNRSSDSYTSSGNHLSIIVSSNSSL